MRVKTISEGNFFSVFSDVFLMFVSGSVCIGELLISEMYINKDLSQLTMSPSFFSKSNSIFKIQDSNLSITRSSKNESVLFYYLVHLPVEDACLFKLSENALIYCFFK